MTYEELKTNPHVYRAYKTLILTDALLADLDLLEMESKQLKNMAFRSIYAQDIKMQGKRFKDLLLKKFEPLIKPADEDIDALAVADQISAGGGLIDRLLKIQLQVSELDRQYQSAFDKDLDLLCGRYLIEA
jgi:hypothetical protein